MITELDKAYAAGFFDGEGSVFISPPRSNRGFTVEVSIGQKSRPVLDWIAANWGGKVTKMSRKDAFIWRTSSKTAGVFLSDIAPYLQVKRRPVELALQLQATKSLSLRNTDQYLEFCSELRKRIRDFNLAD